MKIIEVGCAVIQNEGKILIAQRKTGSYYGGYWEFPGGKQEPGETIEQCLVREVREELGVEIEPLRLLRKTSHTYPEREVLLHFYLCRLVSGQPSKIDCEDFCWIEPKDSGEFQFLPADGDILEDLKKG
jgi:mutator protein MutT